jgi:hypothetical protein
MADRFNRRDFIKTIGAGTIVLAWPQQSHAYDKKSLLEARRKDAHRRRRIIMNNDGNDTRAAATERPVTPEKLLEKRTTALVGSQVDSVFYCTGVFNYYFHRSKESELLVSHEGVAEYLKLLSEMGTDPLEIMVDFCHKNDLEVFWSMRMNDTHDSGNPLLFCQWKSDHPDYLVGTKGVKYPYGANRWSSVDYGVPAVRDKVFRILRDVCSRYDVDGIELDFFRHPVLFKAQMTGEPVTQSHCDQMTGLIQRVRKMTEEIGLQRKRPILIGIRIPDSVSYCKAIGIDLTQWLKQDLIDIVVGGGYFKLEPWENLAALGKTFDVPVYACLVKRRIQSSKAPEGQTEPKIWRGEAYMAWKAGVNGIYTFNRFNPKDPVFRELGDSGLLEKLDRIDRTAYVNEECWSRPEVWLVDGRDYVKKGVL